MKLIYCIKCQDIVRLVTENIRQCRCKQSSGQYEDKLTAWYSGPCIPIGVDNKSLLAAVTAYSKDQSRTMLEVFTIKKDCSTFIRKDIK